ncbi:TauD/TfdA family dioxygenase [Pseudomaricurvus sp. HS19]|uniref:TauD/TfdA dioxygenase family protein n=1 Tax=Pseudomaricurvus sp. HS19 TaxID=2692626 RepID=UPI00136E70F9|nr:TauD/TfdA family dioxygenase [Pseudomaricurvus sp. HS19]MYM61921.1 TauD/TfdA family dioxygenase [Pseudomaricurvus sp. HS19]
MSAAQELRVKYRDIKPEIGAEILEDKATLLSGVYASELRDLLEQKGVLVLPQIHFTDEEQVAFTKTLGQLAQENRGADVYKVTLDKSQTSTADYLKGSFYWHFDGAMNPTPIRASILSSKVISLEGGNTEFANTYAAYEGLPVERKQQIADLRAVYAATATQMCHTPEPSYEEFMRWRALGRVELPLVWKHESGRKSLVIGNYAVNVLGMDPLDGIELLVYLRDWATQERYHYSHKWSVGDTVIWDNTGTLHRAMPYPLDCGRMLHRTKLQGEEPLR